MHRRISGWPVMPVLLVLAVLALGACFTKLRPLFLVQKSPALAGLSPLPINDRRGMHSETSPYLAQLVY